MASETKLRRFTFTFSLLLLITAALIPQPVIAAPAVDTSALPSLAAFISSVKNGNADTLTGVYVDGIFALPVVQQPASDAGYVSTINGTLTQFGLASQYGNVGLLAHNYLSGEYFFELMPEEKISLIFGDGHIETFQIAHIYRYQATDPYSTTSNFIDLNTGEYLTASQLFSHVYEGSRRVTFQTCITNYGNSSWGRLFVIAEPEASQPAPTNWH